VQLALALLLVAAFVAASIAVVTLARRIAPSGSVFRDSDRAAGVFSVLGTSFAVLLAFVIFLAYGTYDRAKDKASLEAAATSQLFRTAHLLPGSSRLEADLVCYARAVVHREWRSMRSGEESGAVERWVRAGETAVDAIVPQNARERAAYAHWFGAEADRREGRRGRLEEATPFVPLPIWLVLGAGALLVVGYLGFYADPGERWFVQAFMTGTIAATIASSIAIIWFLDHPYTRASGGLRPTAMRESLAAMRPTGLPLPCDRTGA
jgi:hypothetical protein